MEMMGIKSEVVAVKEQLAFWQWVGDVTTAFNLSITVVSLRADK